VVGAGARPYGLAAVETLRIESGLIFIGYDYFSGETSPFDMSLDRFIHLDGLDFCGRDALAREAAGPPNRLISLVLDGAEVPEYGAAVMKDGVRVGTLTSPCKSPSLGGVIGMAVMHTDLARVGEQVEVELANGAVGARVATLPVYDPDKIRPRA
jgi:aminomethyltransferase